MRQDLSDLRVPVKNSEGKEVLETFNPTGKQSDGSQYFFPTKLVDNNHEHTFVKAKSTDRHVMCECGFGGDVFPHNSDFRDGHVYDKKGNLKG